MTNDELIRKIISKSVEKYGVDFDYIMAHQFFDGVPWYQHFTHTTKEHQEWKDWSLKLLKKKYPRTAEKEFIMLDLMWGLKVTD